MQDSQVAFAALCRFSVTSLNEMLLLYHLLKHSSRAQLGSISSQIHKMADIATIQILLFGFEYDRIFEEGRFRSLIEKLRGFAAAKIEIAGKTKHIMRRLFRLRRD